MDNNAPIKYSDLIQPDDSISKLREELAAVSRQYVVLMEEIKKEAGSVRASLAGVSGATLTDQKVLEEYNATVEKLNKKQAQLIVAKTETAKQLAEEAQKLREVNNELKTSAKLRDAQPGSYNALSAQYARIKKDLNNMSAQERKTTKEGQELEKQAAAIYLEMKKLQEVTGKHTLSVGDYGIATANLASDIRNAIQALTQMRIEMAQLEAEGQKGSDRWTELSNTSQRLAKDLRDLKREYQITKLETNALGQQTRYLNDIIGVLSTGAGGLSALTGTMKLFGLSTENTSEALVQLNAVMAIANGVSQAWNSLFKQGNILNKIREWQNKQLAKSQALLNATNTKATVIQALLNKVAAANPYLLLAGAILLVVGAIAAWIAGANNAIKQQKILNEQTAIDIEFTKTLADLRNSTIKENIASMEREIEVLKARKAAEWEILVLEKRIQRQREIMSRQNLESEKEYKDNLEANRSELVRLEGELANLKRASAMGWGIVSGVDLNGQHLVKRAAKLVPLVQKAIDNLKAKVEIGVELVVDEEETRKQAQILHEQENRMLEGMLDTQRSAARAAEDVRVDLIAQRFKKERAMTKNNAERQIQDLYTRLIREKNLDEETRASIFKTIERLRTKLSRDLEVINNKEKEANIKAARDTEDARFAAMQDTAQKRKLLLDTQYQRDIEDLEFRLATEKDLTDKEREEIANQIKAREEQYKTDTQQFWLDIYAEELDVEAQYLEDRLNMVSENTKEAMELRLEAIENQREAELTANRMLAEEERRDEQEINDKYDYLALREEIRSTNELNKQKLEAELEYEEAVFNLKEHSETEIQRFQLRQQKERLLAELKAQEAMLTILSGEERAATERNIETIRLQIIALNRELNKTAKVNNIWELFGLSADIADALQTVADQVLDSLHEITEARIQAAEAAEEQAKREADAAQDALQAELEARANGYANEVATTRQELELKKKAEKEATEAKKKAQEDQAKIDTLTQISSLITASANIWSALGGISRIAAIAAIATMFGSFAYAKIRASQITKESYGEGTVQLLQGGSHQSGNDIDLGTKPDGTKRRAEGGEFFAVINKRNSRKYRQIIPDVIHSLNDGSFATRYLGASERVGELAFATTGSGTDVSQIEKDVEQIRKQNETRVYTDPQGNTILIYKNLTRKLKS